MPRVVDFDENCVQKTKSKSVTEPENPHRQIRVGKSARAQRKRAKHAQSISQKQIDCLFEGSQQGLIVHRDFKPLLANRAFAEIFGYQSVDEILDMESILVLAAPDERSRWMKFNRARMKSQDAPNEYEYEGLRKDGSKIWLQNLVRVVEWDGEPTIQSTIIDITERKRAEEALRQSEERLRLLLQSAGEAIYGLDMDGKCTFCNPMCLDLLGYDEPSELLGRNMLDLIHHTRSDGTSYPEEQCNIYRAFKRGESIHLDDEVLWRRDGTSFPADYRSFPIRRDKAVIGAVVTFADISERKQAAAALREREEQLHDLQRQLEHVSRLSAMGQLTSAIAHQLNQPLTAIMAYSGAARRTLRAKGGPNTAEVVETLDKVIDQAADAGATIRHLRGLFESGKTQPTPESVNQIIEDAMALESVEAAEVGIRCELNLGENLPVTLLDKIQIQQVVLNLIRNAVEAMTNSRSRELSIRTGVDQSDTVKVTISDTGPGIAPEIERHLFQPFATSKPGGLGLGLPISHRIIEAHGGRLWAEPNPDGGTQFHFTLLAG